MGAGDSWGSEGGREGYSSRRNALSEIAAEIDRLEARLGAPRAREDNSAQIDKLAARLAAIVDSLKAREPPGPAYSSRGASYGEDDRLSRLAEAVRQIEARLPASRSPSDMDQTLLELRRRLDRLRPSPTRAASLSDELDEGDARQITERRLRAALEEISARQEAIDRPPAALVDESAAITALREDIARVKLAIEGTARESTLASVEAGYGHLAERIDRLARERGQAELGLAGLPREVELLVKRVEELSRALPERDRLNDLATGVAQLGRAIASRGSDEVSATDSRLIELASAVGSIKQQLERNFNQDGDRAMEQRFADIADRLERSLANAPMPGDQIAHLDALHDEMRALRQAIMGSGRGSQETHERPIGQQSLYARVEEDLNRLEKLLLSSQERSIEVAREAARAAIAELAETAPNTENSARALKDELRRLQALAVSAENRTQDSLGTVQRALDKVVARLAVVEDLPPSRGSDLNEASLAAEEFPPAPVDTWRNQSGAQDDESPPRASPPSTERPADRKADFIAAARRAAQAAAVEAAVPKQEAFADRKKGPLGRLSNALRGRGRPALLAAVAVSAALAGVRFFAEADGSGSAEANNPVISFGAEPRRRYRAPIENSSAVRPAPNGHQTGPLAEAEIYGEAIERRTALAFAPPAPTPARFATDGELPPTGNFAPAQPDLQKRGGSTSEFAAPAIPPAPPLEPSIGPALLRAAAMAGDSNAIYEVASRYATGREVPRNPELAAQWYGQAAGRGMAMAAFRLASIYERGDGVEIDRNGALQWYAKAADQGNVRAMHNLAVMLSEGVDNGAPDYAQAALWFQRAAEHGVKDSQYNIGVILARGLGRKADLVQSYKWFALAAAQGDADSASRRDEVAKALSPDQLAQARASVQAWRVAPPLEAANSEPGNDPSWQAPPETRLVLDRQGLVKKVQALLVEQGFDPGPSDGNPGAKTKAAVKAFQASNGLKPDGEIDASLLSMLSQRTG